jgi:hypothetical protein
VLGGRALLPQLTEGERRMAMVLVAVGLFGAALAFAILWRMGQGDVLEEGLSLRSLWFAFSGGIGAMAGLFAARRWFGHPGLRGWLAALWGGVVLCFVAALAGGTLALPLYGTMFAPMMLALTLWSSPLLVAMWGSVLIGSHLQMRFWRAERDTIFLPRPALSSRSRIGPAAARAAAPAGRPASRRPS